MALPLINPKVLAALKAIQDGKRKPIVVTNPNDPRLKAYQDSADLYNYTKLQKTLEKPENVNRDRSFWDATFNDKETLLTKQGLVNAEILAKKSKELVKNNPRLKFGLYANPVATEKHYDENKSHDIYNPNIRPMGQWFGTGKNNDYSNVQPQQPVILQTSIPAPIQTPAPKPVVVVQKTPPPPVIQRTPVVVPAKIPIKLAPTNFTQPLPATPAPQPVSVAQPVQPAPPNKPDSLWAPGQRYSLKDEKVRRMLKAIQSLKRQ